MKKMIFIQIINKPKNLTLFYLEIPGQLFFGCFTQFLTYINDEGYEITDNKAC